MAVKFKAKPKAAAPKKKPVLKKKKPAAKTATKAALQKAAEADAAGLFFNEVIDQLGELEPEYLKAQEVMAEYSALLKKLHADCGDMGNPEHALQVQGNNFVAEFTARANKSTVLVKNPAIIEAMGQDTFNACAKVGVGDLKKYLTEDELDGVLEVTQSGPRKVKIVPKN